MIWQTKVRARPEKIKNTTTHIPVVNHMCSKTLWNAPTVVCGLHLRNLAWLFIFIFVQEQRSKPDQASAWLSETVLILYTVSVSSRARGTGRIRSVALSVPKGVFFHRWPDLRWEAKQPLDWLVGIIITIGYHYKLLGKALFWIFTQEWWKNWNPSNFRSARARRATHAEETGRHDGGDGRASPPRGARRPQWRCQGNGAPRHRAKKGSGGDRAVQERRERGYKRQRAQGRHQP